MRIHFIFWLVILNISFLQGQQEEAYKISFNLYAPEISDSVDVYITGSHELIGYWNPGKVKMHSIGNHNWNYSIIISELIRIEYKYTLGSYENEGVSKSGKPFSNFIIDTKINKAVSDTIIYWKNKETISAPFGQITGEVRYHYNFSGEEIQERDVILWLPPGYNENSKYPVLYMQDGQNIVDSKTSTFGVDWQIDETLDSLISNNIIPPLIVVGIYNSSERTPEYTPGEKGEAYMNFVVNILKPFIDSVYNTKTSRDDTFVGGSSAGGTISFMLLWNYSEVFSKAICLSPAFKIGHIDLVSVVEGYKGKRKDIMIYMDNGGVGIDEKLQPGIDDMITALEKKQFEKNKDYFFFKDVNAQHSEAEWAKRFPEAIKLIMGY